MRKIDIPKELLIELYAGEHLTLQQIAEEFGVNRQTISNKLKEYGIPVRNSTYIRENKKVKLKAINRKKPYHRKEVYERVYKELKSIDGVARYFNIDVKTAFKWKKRLGIETIREYSQKGKRQMVVNKPYANEEWLRKMYAEYSLEDLGKMLNCSPSTISKWCKKFNIQTRNTSEQWELKTKNGNKCLTSSGFDLQLYKKIYAVGRNGVSIPKTLRQSIINAIGKCEACGYSEVLDLHHIDFNHGNNDPVNHAVLCPNCHAKIHRLGIPFEDLVSEHLIWTDFIENSYQEAK